jgi:protein involved in polysaccharide export with SLBB domain
MNQINCRTLLRGLLLLGALLLPAAAAAQDREWNPQGFLATRAELTAQLERYEAAAGSTAYGAEIRRQARREAELIRSRLEQGDFRTGDQIVLQVEFEPALTETFVVTADRKLTLPYVGQIPMDGVLRAELTEHLRREIGRYVRDPNVRAQSLLRLTVTGQVGRGGFLVVPSDALVTDVLTAAGGPSGNAAIDRIHIERAGQVIWEGMALQENIIAGRTLDQLNLQAGDRIVVPEVRRRGETFRWALATLPPLLFIFSRFF